jgi:branched-chain amino acid transport system substrate-binding protein
VLDLSGPAAELGLDSQRGVEMAVEARAEIAGHPLELQTEDSACSREGGQATAQTIVSDPSIVGLIGTSCSSAALPAAQIVAENGYVMISPSNTTPGLTDPQTHQEGYFRTSHNDEVQGLAMAQFAYDELGARTAAAIHEGESYSEGLARVFGDAFVALGGEMVAIEPVSPSAGEVQPLLNAIRDGGPPDFLYYPVFANVGAAITEQARQREGLRDTILAGSDGMLIPLFLENSGDDALGMFLSGPDLTFESLLYNDFLTTYEERYGEAPPAPFHAHAFDATNILLDAIEQVVQVGNDGTLLIGRQALRDAVAATTNHAGITGTLTCDENGDCAEPRIAVYEVQDTGDGPAFVPIWTYTP